MAAMKGGWQMWVLGGRVAAWRGGASFGPLLQETIAQGPQAVTGGLVSGEKGTELLL